MRGDLCLRTPFCGDHGTRSHRNHIPELRYRRHICGGYFYGKSHRKQDSGGRERNGKTVVQRIETELPESVTVKTDAAEAYTECCEICPNEESAEDANAAREITD